MESSNLLDDDDGPYGIVSLVENTEVEEFQATIRKLDHPTRQMLAEKLALFRDIILLDEEQQQQLSSISSTTTSSSRHNKTTSSSDDDVGNNKNNLHDDDDNNKTLKLSLRSEHRRCVSNGSGGGSSNNCGNNNEYTPTLDTIVLDKNGKTCFDMAARDVNAMKMLVQTIQSHLCGVRIIQLDVSTFQAELFNYRPIQQLLLEACCMESGCSTVEELVISTSFPTPLAETLDRIIIIQQQHNNQQHKLLLRRLTLNLTSNLEEPATKTIARWICNQPELELNTGFLTAMAVATIGDAIARTTKLHRLRIGPGLIKKMERVLGRAIRVNQSLVSFQTDLLTPSSICLLKSISEKSKLVKDFKVLYDDTSSHHKGGVVGDAVVKMLQGKSWIGGLTFLSTKPTGPDSGMCAEMSSILKALWDNTSLRSFSLFVGPPKEKSFRDACWEALIKNTTLESFRLDLSTGAKQEQQQQQDGSSNDESCAYSSSWETDFIFDVLPHLSIKDLTIQGGVMNLPNNNKMHDDDVDGVNIHHHGSLWESLACNKKLKKLTISEIQCGGESSWEPSFVTNLPSLSLETLNLPNFDPRVAGWDSLLQSLKSNTQLLSMECDHFNYLRRSRERRSAIRQWFGGIIGVPESNINFVSSMNNLTIEDHERQMLQQLERYLFLNMAGRRLFLPSSSSSSSQGKNITNTTSFKRNTDHPSVLCPYVFERINQLHTITSKGYNYERGEKAKKADAIFEFLRDDLFMTRSYMVANK